MWELVQVGREFHVIPLNDIGEHIESQGCWCDPDVEWIDEKTGLPFPGGCVVNHNSADHREEDE